MKNIIQNFYNIIFAPQEAMENISQNQNIEQAFCVVILISIFRFVVKYNFMQDFSIANFICSGFCYIFGAIAAWCFFALFIDFIANIFDKGRHKSELLNLTAYIGILWIFLAPLNLLKDAGAFGYIFSILAQTFLIGYSIFLHVKAVEISYKLTFVKSCMLMCIPLIGYFFATAWTIEFFSKLVYMFSK